MSGVAPRPDRSGVRCTPWLFWHLGGVAVLVLLGMTGMVLSTAPASETSETGATGSKVVEGPLPPHLPAPLPHAPQVTRSDTTQIGEGTASYYGDELAGHPTASGEIFDPSQLTAAHRSLPFGSKLRVTNLGNGRTVTVRINDRGPFTRRRIIDLSYAAAQRLGMVKTGIAHVRLELLR